MSSSPLQSSPYTLRRRIRDTVTYSPNWLYTLLGIPGFVQPIDYPDIVTGNRIRVKVGRRFTVVTVNNRDYYFRRLTGIFDGTGYSYCISNEESLDCILGRIPESKPLLSLWGRLKLKMRSIDWGCWL